MRCSSVFLVFIYVFTCVFGCFLLFYSCCLLFFPGIFRIFLGFWSFVACSFSLRVLHSCPSFSTGFLGFDSLSFYGFPKVFFQTRNRTFKIFLAIFKGFCFYVFTFHQKHPKAKESSTRLTVGEFF